MQASVIDTPRCSGDARLQILPAGLEMALDHQAEDAPLAARDARRHVAAPPRSAARAPCAELACEQSIITCSRKPASRSTAQAASTLGAS